jgi:hypothetical protein
MVQRKQASHPGVLLLAGAFAVTGALLSPVAWAYSARPLIWPTGAAAGDYFGVSVSGAGDVNGDGYADVIVGAHLNDAGGSEAGRAYVYYGGPVADAVADLSLTGEGAGDNFGVSVSTAGDFNGDGYADVIVGANGNNAGGSDAGRAYVYYGGPGADAVADLTLTGAAALDDFGISVSGGGDVNGDGYADVIVGAHYNDAGGAQAGRAYVYYGEPYPDAVADLSLTGAAASDFFGRSVSAAGDVNGDGYDDVIVGAHGNDAGATNAGRAYVYHGGPGADTVADLMLTGAAVDDYFGYAVSTAGDVNGDGYDDVIVGAFGNDVGGPSAGRAYVYYGGAATDAVADLTLTGASPGDIFGTSVSAAGDVNGDGCGDFLVGASANDAGGLEAGRGYVYFGGRGVDAVADITLTGVVAGDNFGTSVSAAGDINGDGYTDVIVGAWGSDAAGTDAGRAYVYTSRPYEVLSPDGGEQWVEGASETIRWLGADPADLWISLNGGAGYSLLASRVGGTDRNEFVVTAPGPATSLGKIRVSASGESVTHASSDESDGAFSIVSPRRPPAAAVRLQASPTGEPGDLSGYSVSCAGDVDGDGFADMIVGAYQNDTVGADAGWSRVYYGGPGSHVIADLALPGEAAGDYFGYSVSGAGDVNGDGYADVIVGAYMNDAGGASAGRAYVYYGGPGADPIADLTLTGAANENLGYSVSTAGDVNGDACADVIVGAVGSGAGGAYAGRAYVYYGGPGADAVADLTLTGAASADYLGISVSTAGDVNGDGFDDVIVGANGNDAGGTDAGRAYVYYGGPGVDAVADLTLTGAVAGDEFGRSVSTAGDVNGDGHADVIVGAYRNGAGGTLAGRAYVYYGGPGADTIADLLLTGAAASDYFGIAVSTAGDVNGDGCDDVIVGASGNDAGGTDAGRAYVHDVNRYHLVSPNGGETWNVGAMKTISWLGAEAADVWLSTDGGDGDERLASLAGGAATNTIAVRVPHFPTRFARIIVRPSDAAVAGGDQSDSLFTIQTSVTLLSMLAAPLPEGGASITWQTAPGPEDLAGYRIERNADPAGPGGEWRVLVSLTRETSVTDPAGGPGTRYRLFAVNGLGEDLWLGEASLRPLAPLAAWPLPYRGGSLSVVFATASAVGGAPAAADVALYDVGGRLVRTIARGRYAAGYQSASWDGRDDHGHEVAAGIYFLRVRSGDHVEGLKLAVLR